MNTISNFRKYSLFLVLAVLVTIHPSCAQKTTRSKKRTKIENKSSDLYIKALQYSRAGKSNKAHEVYDQILVKDPKAVLAHLMKGGLYYESNELDLARVSFNNAIEIDSEYNPEVFYSLALVENKTRNYRAAFIAIQSYLNNISSEHQKWEKAQEFAESLEFKAQQVENPVTFEKELLPFPINTDNPEYVPLFTADGETMIFVRRTGNQEDLYSTTWDGDAFSMPKLIENISTLENEGVHTISADGKTLIFTGCNRRDSYGSCDLYYSYAGPDGEWSRPSNMGKIVNSASWDGQPSLSSDGQTLYFSSTRAGGIGGKDIWITSKNKSGSWEIPKNLSGAINTLGNDETPYIHADNVTLYYRSDGRLGMGGFDVYQTQYDYDISEWSVPINVGYPINTEADEGGLTVDLNGEMAYYAGSNGEGDIDIFRFTLPNHLRPHKVTFFKGKVIDVESKKPLITQLKLSKIGEESVLESTTDLNGEALIALPVGHSYGLVVEKEGYLFFSEEFRLDSIFATIEPFRKTIELIPIEDEKPVISRPVVLNNIFFESGSAVLLPQSQLEIERLADLMKRYPKWMVQITGHTDAIGTEEDNLILSESRAKSVVYALIDHGVTESRLTAIGKGESQPIADNNSYAGRQSNRRTEFLILP